MKSTNAISYILVCLPLFVNVLVEYCLCEDNLSDQSMAQKRHWSRIIGTIIMVAGIIALQTFGVIDVVVMMKYFFPSSLSLKTSITVGCISLAASLFIVMKQPNVSNRIAIHELKRSTQYKMAVVWIVYLCCYETIFRVILLPANSSNNLSVVLLNTLIYCMCHMHRGKTEMLASIPFGMLVCGIVILAQSVWPAMVAHTTLALFTHFGNWGKPANAFGKKSMYSSTIHKQTS